MMFGNINSSGAVIDGLQRGDASDILLPNQTGRVQKVAVDIGGSLAKVVYLTTSGGHDQGGRLHFTAFETDNVEKCVAFIRTLLTTQTVEKSEDSEQDTEPPLVQVQESSSAETSEAEWERPNGANEEARGPVIRATGGGAHRFRELLGRELGVKIEVEDEMESLTTGLNFLIREVTDEVFTYSENAPMQFENPTTDEMFPYMLVNIGSGVSIIKVTGEGQHERISGTSLGGGTLWGLLNLLTGVRSFDEMLDMTKTGDNTKVDMMVGDIYGTNYDKIGLKATNIAATMAGVYRKSLDKQFDDADIARSLLYMVSNNIGQIAYLNAQLHGIKRIYFGGYFIRGHPLTMHTLSYAINFWSKGEMRALFLRHEGFLGATGAFVMASDPGASPCVSPSSGAGLASDKDAGGRRVRRHKAYSFTENFSITETIADEAVSSLGMLDRQSSQLLSLPQLINTQQTPYQPDTVDLSKDLKQQEYWISAMEKNTHGLLDLAENGTLSCGRDTRVKMESFVALYLKHLRRLRERPHAYGPMSVRTLLGLREQCLHEVGLEDIFASVKRRETDDALEALPNAIAQTDAISDEHERLRTLLHNVLAGNMFDWGSTSLRDMLADGNLNFDQARDKVNRPSRFNNADEFIGPLLNGERQGYQRAVIFVDNSGADVCLGVLPLARYLVATNTHVVLAANSRPALNDVTERELADIVRRAAKLDSIISMAVSERRLEVCGTGSGGPCLDLRKLDERLVRHCQGADLMVIVGMGRAIHSNYRARFTCDSLKLAVFKNQMAADAANAEIYDALCLYAPKAAR
ncbi:fumble-domain-containing protein [Martensiomyces pterosporus]|nr:fumble-domain-containing protein [Martensiomyces pterosporus]